MKFEVIWTKEADTTLGEIILHLKINGIKNKSSIF